jgi:hypothetical protein
MQCEVCPGKATPKWVGKPRNASDYKDPREQGWTCVDLEERTTITKALNDSTKAGDGTSNKVDGTFPSMACTYTEAGEDGVPVDYAIYSRPLCGFSTAPTAPCKGKGGEVVATATTNFDELDWAWLPPTTGDGDKIRAAAELGGLFMPYGCMFAKPNIAPPPKSSETASGGESSSPAGGCNGSVMKQLTSTCKIIDDAKEKQPDANMCRQMKKDKLDFELKLKKLQQDDDPYKNLIEKAGEAISDFTPGGMMRNLGAAIHTAIGTDNKSIQNINNALNINVDINQTQQALALCSNKAINKQTNKATISGDGCPNPYPDQIDKVCGRKPCEACMIWQDGECVPLDTGEAMTNCLKDGAMQSAADGASSRYLDCLASPNGSKMREDLLKAEVKFQKDQVNKPTNKITLTQDASNDIKQKCEQDVAQKALTDFAAGIDNQIAQQVAQTAKNFSAANSSEEDVCNNININMSACNYQSSQTCCENSSSNDQLNDISISLGCSPSNIDIKQSLKNTQEQMCSQGVHQDESATGKADIANKISQAATQTAIGMDPMAFFMIIAIIIGVICLAPIGLTFIVGTKIILIMGIVIMLIGFCQFPAYFSSGYKAASRADTPFVFTARKDAPLLSFKQDTFESALRSFNNDSNAQAFDFFPNCLAIPDQENRLTCSTNISDNFKSFPNSFTDPNTGDIVYPPNTPGQALYYKTVSKSVSDGVACIKRGDVPPGNGDKEPAAYMCDLAGFSKREPDAGGDVPPINLPIFKGKDGGSGDAEAAKTACKARVADSCTAPSVSYIKAYSETAWLWSAIVTTIIGIIFLGIGIWLQTSGKKHQRPSIWSKKKTAATTGGSKTAGAAPAASFNSSNKKKAASSRRKAMK